MEKKEDTQVLILLYGAFSNLYPNESIPGCKKEGADKTGEDIDSL